MIFGQFAILNLSYSTLVFNPSYMYYAASITIDIATYTVQFGWSCEGVCKVSVCNIIALHECYNQCVVYVRTCSTLTSAYLYRRAALE